MVADARVYKNILFSDTNTLSIKQLEEELRVTKKELADTKIKSVALSNELILVADPLKKK